MNLITSRENPLVRQLRALARDNTAYREHGLIWVEGDHLCRAALDRGVRPEQAVFAESFWNHAPEAWKTAAPRQTVLSDRLFAEVSGLESPARMGYLVALAPAVEVDPAVASVVIDRVQDAGNVGSILRSAAAFGFRQVLALKGTAALWSPKVLRAGMGAHFGLSLLEGLEPDAVGALAVPLLATSSHQGPALHELVRDARLPRTCAWVLGHEGQGVREDLMARAVLRVRIDQPGGEESLNVAAAAAICLHASATA
jgi:RNA methyltransferase, TrmH family